MRLSSDSPLQPSAFSLDGTPTTPRRSERLRRWLQGVLLDEFVFTRVA
ncbi:hypothetical protein [Arthrobacter globiformis]|nr:hypothetical protein [Arthrobacter globiformis]